MFGWLRPKRVKIDEAKDEELRVMRGQLAQSVVDLDRNRTRLEKLMVQMLEERARDAN